MIYVFSLIGEVAAWVGSLGLLLSFIIPQPALQSPLTRFTWAVFLGAIFTPLVRPIVKNIMVMLWNWNLRKNVVASIPPESVQVAKDRGIKTPLDFCVYMAAYQTVPQKHVGRALSFYGMTDGEYSPARNRIFREMFGRMPLTMYNDGLNFMIVMKDSMEQVAYTEVKDCWKLCLMEEAAQVANIDPEEVTPNIVEQYTSPEIRELLKAIGETTVLAWSK